MAKFNKMYYYTSTGEKKLNCYNIAIPKDIVEKAKLDEKEVKIRVIENRIVIERK